MSSQLPRSQRASRVDPRLKVALGITLNLALLVSPAVGCLMVVIALVAWLTSGDISKAMIQLWIGIQLAIVALFSVTVFMQWESLGTALTFGVRWSAGVLAGLLLVMWSGTEDLGKVVVRLPIPGALGKAFGFALRAAPVLSRAINVHRRDVKIIALAGTASSATRSITFTVGEVLLRTIDGIDKIVSQIELRGYDVAMFGDLPSLVMTRRNLLTGLASASLILLAFGGLLLW